MKTALVTGVSKGIGESTAQLLLESGWKVYGISRSKPRIDSANLVWIQIDLEDKAAISTIEEKISEAGLDLLVSNAGVAFLELASSATAETYKNTWLKCARADYIDR